MNSSIAATTVDGLAATFGLIYCRLLEKHDLVILSTF